MHLDQRAKWWPYLAAAALYASIAIAWTWPLALQSRRYVAMPPTLGGYDLLASNDQLLSIWGAAANARAFLDLDFRRLIDNGTCWPLPNAATLGEHMIELGILALPGYALTADPLVAYNSACLLLVVIAGVTMFALVRSWTGSTAAGLVAGFLYAFHPMRINDLVHPAVVGTHWIPLVLLMFERTITTGTIRSAVLLWLVTMLTCLTGSYPMLILLFFGAPYGLVRFVQLRRRVTRAGVLALGSAVVGVAVAILPLLLEYGAAADAWYSLRTRFTHHMLFEGLLPGRATGVGALVLPLAALAVLFRRRAVGEPVAALAVAGTACVFLSCHGPLWPGGPPIASFYETLGRWISLLTVVRAGMQIRVGVYFALAALAGIGLARALAGRHNATRVVACTLLLSALVTETFVDRYALMVYAGTQEVSLRDLRPSEETLATYAAFDEHGYDGPILDMPYDATRGHFGQMARYMLFAAYHGHPTAACHNSFLPPTYDNVGRLSARFAKIDSADEIVAAGFHDVVWHSSDRTPLPAHWTANPRISILRRTDEVVAVHLETYPQVHEDRERLQPRRLYQDGELRAYGQNDPRLYVTVENMMEEFVWAHPTPIAPVEGTLSWLPADTGDANGTRYETRASVLLPLALAIGPPDAIPLPVLPLPPPGRYRVTLDVPSLDWHVVADELVTVAG